MIFEANLVYIVSSGQTRLQEKNATDSKIRDSFYFESYTKLTYLLQEGVQKFTFSYIHTAKRVGGESGESGRGREKEKGRGKEREKL